LHIPFLDIWILPIQLYLNVQPNPFSKLTTIKFPVPTLNQVQGKSQIILKIHDAAGRLVEDFSRFTLDALRFYFGMALIFKKKNYLPERISA